MTTTAPELSNTTRVSRSLARLDMVGSVATWSEEDRATYHGDIVGELTRYQMHYQFFVILGWFWAFSAVLTSFCGWEKVRGKVTAVTAGSSGLYWVSAVYWAYLQARREMTPLIDYASWILGYLLLVGENLYKFWRASRRFTVGPLVVVAIALMSGQYALSYLTLPR